MYNLHGWTVIIIIGIIILHVYIRGFMRLYVCKFIDKCTYYIRYISYKVWFLVQFNFVNSGTSTSRHFLSANQKQYIHKCFKSKQLLVKRRSCYWGTLLEIECARSIVWYFFMNRWVLGHSVQQPFKYIQLQTVTIHT